MENPWDNKTLCRLWPTWDLHMWNGSHISTCSAAPSSIFFFLKITFSYLCGRGRDVLPLLTWVQLVRGKNIFCRFKLISSCWDWGINNTWMGLDMLSSELLPVALDLFLFLYLFVSLYICIFFICFIIVVVFVLVLFVIGFVFFSYFSLYFVICVCICVCICICILILLKPDGDEDRAGAIRRSIFPRNSHPEIFLFFMLYFFIFLKFFKFFIF